MVRIAAISGGAARQEIPDGGIGGSGSPDFNGNA